VTAQTGWITDPESLRETVTDRAAVEAELRTANKTDRLFLLRLLGHLDEALTEAAALLTEPDVQLDPWQVLVLTADVHLWRNDFDAAEALYSQAWRKARSRSRQAITMQHIARHRYESGDLDGAAGCVELALTMRRGFDDETLLSEAEQALSRMRAQLRYDAVILAGGRGRRLGGADKPAQELSAWPLLDHVLLAVSGASTRVVVGPRRWGLAAPVFCREDPPGSGPVAAIAAATKHLKQPLVAVLAADLPFIATGLAALRSTLLDDDQDAAVFVDVSGSINYLAAVWRLPALQTALAGIAEHAGAPVRRLYDGVRTAHVPDFDALGADCDTWADLRSAQERITRHRPGTLPTTPLAWPRLELFSPS
jgi:molybdopterin-guanine dinucleotide biosynthesis protein A